MKLRKWIIPAAVILVGIIAGYFIIKAVSGGVSEEVASGIAYIKDLEKADTDEVEAVLALQRQQRLVEEREEKMRQVADGEIDVWSLFSDYALMGDSRAVGFEVFGFMPDDRVIAGPGWTIRDIEKNMATLQALNPSSIYLCFGLNDVSIGIWQTKEEYAQEYHEILDTLHETFPNAGIYVNSILPARDPAFNTSAKWYEIPDYSNAVKEMCEENGFSFVNNDELAEQYSQYWEIDGIHLQKPFYPYWAANMMMTVYGEGLGDEE